ncbi:MAG: DNA replication/repair protein RecF [Gammaproteobacteria bacterium]
MYLEWLQTGNVRNLQQIRIDPGPGLNIFTGRNASGKTAILESLYLLGRARSFRTPRIQEVISREQETLHVSAGVMYSSSGLRVTTGLEKGRGQVTIRYNGSPVRTVSEQARYLPLVLVTPDSHYLVTGTPKQRRHWLDWAMFHVEPSYLEAWRDYFRALRHRNSLLKSGVRDPGAYRGWEASMGKAAAELARLRSEFIEELESALDEAPATFLEGPDVAVQHKSGWAAPLNEFTDFLAEARNQDREAGFTRYGPHRADLAFSVENIPISSLFSRGQIKMFVCRLIMAEARVLARMVGETPLFLQDDYTAELDNEACERLLSGLSDQGWQCFVNATEARQESILNGNIRRFHVEHGRVTKVVE